MAAQKTPAKNTASTKTKPLVLPRAHIMGVEVVEAEFADGVKKKVANPAIRSYLRALTAMQHVPALTIIALGRMERKAEELFREFLDARFKLVKQFGKPVNPDNADEGWTLDLNDKAAVSAFHLEEQMLLGEEVQLASAPIKLSQLGESFSGITGEDLARCMEVGIIIDDKEAA